MSNILIVALLFSNAIIPELEIFKVCRKHIYHCQPSRVFFFNNSRVMLALALPYEVGIDLNFFRVKCVNVKGLLIRAFFWV